MLEHVANTLKVDLNSKTSEDDITKALDNLRNQALLDLLESFKETLLKDVSGKTAIDSIYYEINEAVKNDKSCVYDSLIDIVMNIILGIKFDQIDLSKRNNMLNRVLEFDFIAIKSKDGKSKVLGLAMDSHTITAFKRQATDHKIKGVDFKAGEGDLSL